MMNPVLDTEGLAKYHQLLKSKELGAKANKSAGVFYIEGTGDTAGVWLGAHSDITEYYPGLMIAYKPSIAGATGLTLNINNLGAVAVVRNTTSAVTTHYGVDSILMLVYTVDGDGTAYWKIADYDSDTKTRSSNKTGSKMYIIGATTQSTSGQTTYSNSNCYIGTDNSLYSKGKKVLDVEGTAASATKLATARTIALAGDATGSAEFDGSGDVTIDVTVSGEGGDSLKGNKITAALPISAGDIVVYGTHILNLETEEAAVGYMPLKDCHLLGPQYPILVASVDIAQGESSDDVFYAGKASVTNIQEMSLTVGEPVYVRCLDSAGWMTLKGMEVLLEFFQSIYPDELGDATVDTSAFLTQGALTEYPELEELLFGYARDYLLLGYAVSETEVLITADHSVFRDTTSVGFVKFVPAANYDGEGREISTTYATKSEIQNGGYTLPAATSSTLGGVKIGSNITNSSGTISLTKANVTNALGYTPLSTSGTAANATKLATPRTITLTGDATGSVSFDGSKDVSLDVTVSGGGGDYLPTTGGTLTGALKFEKTDTNSFMDIMGNGRLIMMSSDSLNGLYGFGAQQDSASGMYAGNAYAMLSKDGKFEVNGKQVALVEEVTAVTYGETDLDAGVSTLATGSIYLMYE